MTSRKVVLVILATVAVVSACNGLAGIEHVGLWVPPDDAAARDGTQGDSSGSGSGAETSTDSGSVDGSSSGRDSESESGSSSGADSGTDAGTDASDASDGGNVIPLSCAPGGPGMSNCGSASESCCTSLEVSGGTYNRTYTNGGNGPTGEADPAKVSTFFLDKYEVTVGRFRQFVNAVLPPDGGAGWLPAAGSGKHTHLNNGQGLVNNGTEGGFEPGWVASDDSNIAPTNSNLNCDPNFATWTDLEGSYENLPIGCENWWEAYAFCIWDGGFLPSEAEWEYAAAGGSQEREYPWGTTDPGTQSSYAIYACNYPGGTSCTGRANIAPVGTATLGAGVWGQFDLEGSVSEWNLDFYATYALCTDCSDLSPSPNRVIRGGDFSDGEALLQPPFRSQATPASRTYSFGLRCARAP